MGNDKDFVLGAQGKGVPRRNLPLGPATGENSRDAEVEPLHVLPLFASGAPSVKSGVAQPPGP